MFLMFTLLKFMFIVFYMNFSHLLVLVNFTLKQKLLTKTNI